MEEEICSSLLMLCLSDRLLFAGSLGEGIDVAYLLGQPSVLYTSPTSQPSLGHGSVKIA